MKRNKGMQLSAIFAVMLLLSMAFVPAVSAEKKSKEKLEDLSISPELYPKFDSCHSFVKKICPIFVSTSN